MKKVKSIRSKAIDSNNRHSCIRCKIHSIYHFCHIREICDKIYITAYIRGYNRSNKDHKDLKHKLDILYDIADTCKNQEEYNAITKVIDMINK